MKKKCFNFRNCMLVCCFFPLVAFAQTEYNLNERPSVRPNAYYDMDGDGTMEFVGIKSDETYRKDFKIEFSRLDGTTFRNVAHFKEQLSEDHFLEFVPGVDGSGKTMVLLRRDRSQNGFGSPIVSMFMEKEGQDGYVNLSTDIFKEPFNLYGNAYRTFRVVHDFDNDGRKDLFYCAAEDNRIYYQQPGGSFVKTALSLETDTAVVYRNAIAARNWVNDIPSLKNGWMIDVEPPRELGTIESAMDLNNDGMADLIDTNMGGILYHIGGNSYYKSNERGTLYPCDLNGDGILDYVVFDSKQGLVSLMMYNKDGSYSSKELMQNQHITNVYYRDFDRDGDMDILLAFGYQVSRPVDYTYLVFFRNDGNASFKRKESSFSELYTFEECMDVDNDGLYEVVAAQYGKQNRVNSAYKVLKCNADFSITASELAVSDSEYRTLAAFAAGDFNNDGIIEYTYGKNDIYSNNDKVISSSFPAKSKNTAPEKMQAPVVVLQPETNRLKITWQGGKDELTSSCDLTYELRIGTEPGKSDILFASSLADGRRRSLQEGNMGRRLFTLFDASSLQEGKYYVCVQAIDAGGLGGAWSDECLYEHKLRAPGFRANYAVMSTADTLHLEVKMPYPDALYEWNVADGRVVEQNKTGVKLVFDRAADCEVSLKMTLNGRVLVSPVSTLTVLPMRSVKRENEEYGGFYADFNQDGYPDQLGNKGVYSNDRLGKLTKVAKSFNSDLNDSPQGIFDFNRDGYPDFLFSASKGNVFINMGERDFDFEYSKKEFTYKQGDTEEKSAFGPEVDFWFDGNNDGYPDGYDFHSDMLYLNNGDNLSFYKSNYCMFANPPANYSSVRFAQVYDVDRDGFMDLISQPFCKRNETKTRWFVFRKDESASHDYEDETALFEFDDEVSEHSLTYDYNLYADLNSDGYLDLILKRKDSNRLMIVKGQKEWPGKEVVEIPLPGSAVYTFAPYYSVTNVLRDFDNNGYPDILLKSEDKYWVLYMYPGFKGELKQLCNDYSVEDSPFIPLSDGAYPELNRCKFAGNIRNEAPGKPENVMVRQTAKGVLITWSDAKDDFTPGMQMQYNVSVKKKNADGEGSFLISPMNALDDRASVVPGYFYKKSTRMLIPLSVLQPGQSYLVQIQAIDLWNIHSGMTAPVEFTVNAAGYVDVQDVAAVGKEVVFKYVGTQAGTFSYALDGGELIKNEGNGSFSAKWTMPGVKNITVTADGNAIKSAVTIVNPANVDFELPSDLLAGAPVELKVPEAMNDMSMNCGFRTSDEHVTVRYNRGDTIALMEFALPGSYNIEAYCQGGALSNTCVRTAIVKETMPQAVIDRVEADGASGCYVLSWNASGFPASVTKVIVSKETNRSDRFIELGTADLSAGRYTDLSSEPQIMSARYKINLKAQNGQVSHDSGIHKPVHLMINCLPKSKGYNLMWNAYEGRDVDHYIILRGATPDLLKEVDRVSGSLLNYTDPKAPEGENYYALTVVLAEIKTNPIAAGNEGTPIRSNIISTKDAVPTVYAENLSILSLEREMALTATQGSLHLFAEVLPLNATFNKVVWTIEQGNELATINQYGLLSATGKGNGDVVVRATAIDGSGLVQEVTISCKDANVDDIGEIIEYNNEKGWNLKLDYDRAVQRAVVSGWAEGRSATLYVVSLNGQVTDVIRTADATAVIHCAGYSEGIYLLKALVGKEARVAKFAKE